MSISQPSTPEQRAQVQARLEALSVRRIGRTSEQIDQAFLRDKILVVVQQRVIGEKNPVKKALYQRAVELFSSGGDADPEEINHLTKSLMIEVLLQPKRMRDNSSKAQSAASHKKPLSIDPSTLDLADDLPVDLRDELLDLAQACEYLLWETDQLEQLDEKELQEALNQFRNVRGRIEALSKALAEHKENVSARVMHFALKQGLNNLNKLELEKGPQTELYRIQAAFKQIIDGDWPFHKGQHESAVVESKGPEWPIDTLKTRLEVLRDIVKSDANTKHHWDAAIRVWGELLDINGLYLRKLSPEELEKDFPKGLFPEGIPKDVLEGITKEFKAYAEMHWQKLLIEFGESASKKPLESPENRLSSLSSVIEALETQKEDYFF